MKSKILKTENQKQNKSVSQDLIVSVRNSLYKLKTYLDNIDFENDDNDAKKATSIITIIGNMGKAMETLSILERKVQSEEDIKSKVRGDAKLSMLETGEI